MRLFIAFLLPQEIKNTLANLCLPLKDYQLKANWVKPDNLHLTLKFLGETGSTTLLQLKNTLKQYNQKLNPLTLSLNQFGFFPQPSRPRVFFISLAPAAQLKAIADNLNQELAALGFLHQDRFQAHITLARIKGKNNLNKLSNWIKTATPAKNEFLVNQISLIESRLSSHGPTYTPLTLE